MNKSAIQKYAIWARNELIEQVKQRAFQYGITDKGYGEENAAVIGGRVLSADEKRQRQSFVELIKRNGFKQAIEEVAYTWFNRFVALRFMEVNDYLPTHIRVFSDANGDFNPQILKDVLQLDLEGLNKVKVSELLNANKTEELYRYLLLTQCNAMNELLPEMFEKMGAYTEMLLPNNILKPDSVIGKLVSDIIPEETWLDGVQIIGWLYQYYNTEPKQAVFDGLKKNIKITRENIPAATQLFTPDWIVRYMVENSLGRRWLESHPDSPLRANWKYYLDEAEQTPEVAERLRVLRAENAVKSPEDIKVIDPCMGSGHILVYAFDVLMQIYTSEGYSDRDAAKLILEKNIYGLEIDRRAYQLAYFALMMKARQYNRRILTFGVRPQVYEPTGYEDGMEYGSLVRVDKLEDKPAEPVGQLTIDDDYAQKLNTWNFRRLLVQKYDVVVTNPPYMGNMPVKMAEYVVENYPIAKYDLYSVMVEVAFNIVKVNCFVSMITQHAWMYLSSFESLRRFLSNFDYINMLHLGARAFDEISGEVVQTTAFVFRNANTPHYLAHFIDLRSGRNESEKIALFQDEPPSYRSDKFRFAHIPGYTVAYWLSDSTVKLFDNDALSTRAIIKSGIVTGNNDLFIKLWYEIDFTSINFEAITLENTIRWVPMHKGGGYRKYYGLHDYVMNIHDIWYSDRVNHSVRRGDPEYYFRTGITWSTLSNNMSARMSPTGFVYDTKGSMCFANNLSDTSNLLALMNSKVCDYFMGILSPTLDFNQGAMGKMPLCPTNNRSNDIGELCNTNISLSRTDWDAFETSWDFKRHPLMPTLRFHSGEYGGMRRMQAMENPYVTDHRIQDIYFHWETDCDMKFDTIKRNEEELNRIFIDIYGLQEELTPEVEDKDVTVRLADLGREIRSLISYAVGCMFGRYSLDVDGLAYAGGDWDAGKYETFITDKDNILPICDDEYFDDDIVGRFVDFVKIAYGAETLDENLKYIADALGDRSAAGSRGTPREIIRKYFLNDFFKDHCKIYQKRPIYWMFDSGKKNGFKALIYLHRYQPDLLARMRTDYVHEQQERYRTQLSHITSALNTATGAERARLLKQQDKLTEQAKELVAYEEKVHHLADKNVEIDLDDGVKKNYEIFADVLAKK